MNWLALRRNKMETLNTIAMFVIAGLMVWKILIPLVPLLLDLERLAQFRRAIAKSAKFRPEATGFEDYGKECARMEI